LDARVFIYRFAFAQVMGYSLLGKEVPSPTAEKQLKDKQPEQPKEQAEQPKE